MTIILQYCRACPDCAERGLIICDGIPHTDCDQRLFMTSPKRVRDAFHREWSPPAPWWIAAWAVITYPFLGEARRPRKNLLRSAQADPHRPRPRTHLVTHLGNT